MERLENIEGYPAYLVSDQGFVISFKGEEKILKPGITNGYPVVTLSNKLGPKTFTVHSLVARAFKEKPRWEINHKDGDKTNNKVTNLEWCTPGENKVHAVKMGLMVPPIRKDPSRELHKITQYYKDGTPIQSFTSVTDAASVTGLLQPSISKALNGTLKTTGGYVWKYT